MTRQMRLVCVAVIVVLGAWAWWQYTERAAKVGAQTATVTASTANVPASGRTTAPVEAVAAPPTQRPTRVHATSVSPLAQDLAETYGCAECPDSPLVARSPAEAAWMQAHGFPTQEQLQRMANHSLDLAKVRAAAERGDLAAMGLYGTVLMREGQLNEGLGYLKDAELRGSIYALYGLSESKLSLEEVSNKWWAAQRIRVAYLLGDSRASDYLFKHFREFDNDRWIIIDRDASEYFRRLRANQAREFGVPPRILPRPAEPEVDEAD